jgi:hypothetical protein
MVLIPFALILCLHVAVHHVMNNLFSLYADGTMGRVKDESIQEGRNRIE